MQQRSFDDLGTPLADVTFCVVDVETTGGSVHTEALTEIGAVKVRGGECLGTFQTLINPGRAIPPEITVLTGITHAMVVHAPRVETVLPAFLEFAEGCVLVGHNVRFDIGFLDAALARAGWDRLRHPSVDTAALARRLLRDEVPNCRLGTLADRFRLAHRPSHRALDDALATTDLLHLELERAAGFGVMGLDDLLALPRLESHPQLRKLGLTTRLPRSCGVYLFRDRRGAVIYVGKAANLRQRVRSYFSGDERRKVVQLLRELDTIETIECRNALEATVLEVRLIHRHLPRFNQQAKRWARYAYVRLSLDEIFPRLAVARAARRDANIYLGPLPSTDAARRVIEAVHTVVPLRRCTLPLTRRTLLAPPRAAACAPAQLGVSTCPCAGTITPEAYRTIVERVVHGLLVDPELLLGPLRDRMLQLAAVERFEEAADMRDRASALAQALHRQRRFEALRRAGRLRLQLPEGGGAELHNGVMTTSWREAELPFDVAHAPDDAIAAAPDAPVPKELADEMLAIASFLDRYGARIRVEHCDGQLAWPAAALASFAPRPQAVAPA